MLRKLPYNSALKFVAGIVSAVVISGCSSIEAVRPDIAAKPFPSRIDEIALINELRSVFVKAEDDVAEGLCFDGVGLKGFKSKSGEGYQLKDDPENSGTGCFRYKELEDGSEGKKRLTEYLSAGFTLTDIYCQRFFTVAAASEQNRKFARSATNGLDTLVGSILTLSSAGDTAIGITNSGFGLVTEGLDAYSTAYLVGPDLAEVRRLVAAAQAEYRSQVFSDDGGSFPMTYAGARGSIERYASLCSYTGMKELVDKAVKDKTDDIAESANPNASGESAGDPGKVDETPAQPASVNREPAILAPIG